MHTISCFPEDISLFKDKALQWAASHEVACYFDSNQYNDPYQAFDILIAAGAIHEISTSAGNALNILKTFLKEHSAWIPGFMSYDLKNELEDLNSENPDHPGFPDLFFFVPEHLVLITGNEVKITSARAFDLPEEINKETVKRSGASFQGEIKSRFSRDEYIHTVSKLKGHIARGDIYELNFCQEFYAEEAALDPLAAFRLLSRHSPAPFSAFFKCREHFIISATPERFLCRRNNKIISQPIKGTIRRSADLQEDLRLKNQLRNDLKEQSENVMIVDLVRNDLTRCALKGTVRVEELFGIYSFRQVHQMISTVTCEADSAIDNTEIIRCTFPMGSMTGAPKVRAMELIDHYERSKRGIFSGSTGYFAPGGDFDFNVVIRSLLYNSKKRYLSFQAGSAITFASDASKEYEECILKTKAIFEILSMADES